MYIFALVNPLHTHSSKAIIMKLFTAKILSLVFVPQLVNAVTTPSLIGRSTPTETFAVPQWTPSAWPSLAKNPAFVSFARNPNFAVLVQDLAFLIQADAMSFAGLINFTVDVNVVAGMMHQYSVALDSHNLTMLDALFQSAAVLNVGPIYAASPVPDLLLKDAKDAMAHPNYCLETIHHFVLEKVFYLSEQGQCAMASFGYYNLTEKCDGVTYKIKFRDIWSCEQLDGVNKWLFKSRRFKGGLW